MIELNVMALLFDVSVTSPVSVTAPLNWKAGSVLVFAAKSPERPVVVLPLELKLVISAVPVGTVSVRSLSTVAASLKVPFSICSMLAAVANVMPEPIEE